ncbi:PadR family transcriptional regulator [Spongiactinospora gelatinilytica]|uniref:PadR family transcriptional regulator n=1 Tax=Spongiactinospora gelatinilytica TaxID=2666298 RepID=A0A2W2GAD7_9ACTN|nr:PadR family transcriptional regulator [Spongiactinospora gelatinilytica]PZG44953.1 PadR family transcriptional regulator [Spongiactinospora gelatinilytica]
MEDESWEAEEVAEALAHGPYAPGVAAIPPHHGGAVIPPHVPPPGPEFAPRVRRGDVRAATLALLREGPRNGYQVIEEISRRSLGVWRPSPGSVYPALQQLEDEGLVQGRESGGSRVYDLTGEGRRHVERRAAELAEPWAEVIRSVPEDRHELRLLWGQVGEAFLHFTRTADDKQVAAAKRLLKETRRGFFKILADDHTDGIDPRPAEGAE